MEAHEVVEIYDTLDGNGIPIWIDGGWCVDALVRHQTREHLDLDIAVARADAERLRSHLEAAGYREESRAGSTPWNFALSDDHGRTVDVHVFQFDTEGNNIYGIEYPRDSLTGEGVIDGKPVRCIRADRMFEFKTAYEPQDKDLEDVRALHDAFGFEVPSSHRRD